MPQKPKQSQKKQLPKTIYVFHENEGTEDEFLNTAESEQEAARCAEHGQTVGVYTLSALRKARQAFGLE